MKNPLKLRKNEKLRVNQSHIISIATQAGSDGAESFTGTQLDSDDNSSEDDDDEDDDDRSDDDIVIDDTVISDDEDAVDDLDVNKSLSADSGDETDMDVSDNVEAIFCRTRGGRIATTWRASLFE